MFASDSDITYLRGKCQYVLFIVIVRHQDLGFLLAFFPRAPPFFVVKIFFWGVVQN